MKTKKAILILVILLTFCSGIFAQNANWICSTNENQWVQQTPVELITNKKDVPFDVEILTESKQQTIDGWGGCFNELGWDALMSLGSEERVKVLKEFFDPKVGLKYNICRIPIGASDYARNWYSLNDTPGDFKMKNFSIERDKIDLIPYIKAAMKIRPDLQIWASPWSPPTWMKTNNHYANKPGKFNDLTEANSVKSGDQFIQKKEYLAAYALYFAKFSKAYQKEGIPIFAIHIQNEPYTYNQWPNCLWTAHAMRDFISIYLGPKFKKERVKSQIWFGTMNEGFIPVFDSVLSNPKVRKYISGAGFQYRGRDAVAHVYKNYPELKRMQTETPCGSGTFDWKAGETTFKTIKSYMDRGVNSYMYWNMILDNTGTSSWGWKQNAQVIIDKTSKKVTYTPEFYIFKHLSTFVVPGSVKINTKGAFANTLSYLTPEGNVILVAVNTEDAPKAICVKIADKYFNVTLPTRSFNTFSFKN